MPINIYGQKGPEDPVIIVGDSDSLLRLSEALATASKVVDSGIGCPVVSSDSANYHILVNNSAYAKCLKLKLPYRGGEEAFSLNSVFPPNNIIDKYKEKVFNVAFHINEKNKVGFCSGQLVRIKSWDMMVHEFGVDSIGSIKCKCRFTEKMIHLCGREFIIESIWKDKTVILVNEDEFNYSTDMIEPV